MRVIYTSSFRLTKSAGLFAVPPNMLKKMYELVVTQAKSSGVSGQMTRIKKEMSDLYDRIKHERGKTGLEDEPFWDVPTQKMRPPTEQDKQKRKRDLDNRKNQYAKLKAELQQLSSVPREKGSLTPVTTFVPLDVQGWPYADKLERLKDVYPSKAKQVLKGVTLKMVPKAAPAAAGAYYIPDKQEIIVYLKQYSLAVNNDSQSLQKIRSDLEHELRHYCQEILDKSSSVWRAGIDPLFGQPSKSISTPAFTADRNDPRYKQRSQEGFSSHDIHSLADDEFQTDLGDAVSMLKYRLEHVTSLPRQQVYQEFLQTDKFLNGLRKYPGAQGKLQQALRELYKAYSTSQVAPTPAPVPKPPVSPQDNTPPIPNQ